MPGIYPGNSPEKEAARRFIHSGAQKFNLAHSPHVLLYGGKNGGGDNRFFLQMGVPKNLLFTCDADPVGRDKARSEGARLLGNPQDRNAFELVKELKRQGITKGVAIIDRCDTLVSSNFRKTIPPILNLGLDDWMFTDTFLRARDKGGSPEVRWDKLGIQVNSKIVYPQYILEYNSDSPMAVAVWAPAKFRSAIGPTRFFQVSGNRFVEIDSWVK